MYVAFSFSTPGLAVDPDFAGDGTSGADIDADEQTAMNISGSNCAARSNRPNWCGVANGGVWEICRADGRTKWAALAVSNDGTMDNWSDGEVIAADSEAAAEQGAVANCGKQTCQLVWSESADCSTGTTSIANGSGAAGTIASPYPLGPTKGSPSGTSVKKAPGATTPKTVCPSGAVCADPAI